MERPKVAMRGEDKTAVLFHPFSWSYSVNLASSQQCHRTSATIQVMCRSLLLNESWLLSNKFLSKQEVVLASFRTFANLELY